MRKFEAIGVNLIDLKKFKMKATKQLTDLDDRTKLFIELEQFRSEHEAYEHRINTKLETEIEKVTTKIDSHVKYMENLENHHDELLADIKKQTIWQIKECKEMITHRIMEQKVVNIVDGLDRKIESKLNVVESTLSEQIKERNALSTKQIMELKIFWENRHKDLKKQQYQFADDLTFCAPKEEFTEL